MSERADRLDHEAESVWLEGRTADALRLRAEAYDAFVAEARPAEAAMSAVLLAILHMGRGTSRRRWAGSGEPVISRTRSRRAASTGTFSSSARWSRISDLVARLRPSTRHAG